MPNSSPPIIAPTPEKSDYKSINVGLPAMVYFKKPRYKNTCNTGITNVDE